MYRLGAFVGIVCADTDPLRFYRRIAVLGLEMLTSGGKLYLKLTVLLERIL